MGTNPELDFETLASKPIDFKIGMRIYLTPGVCTLAPLGGAPLHLNSKVNREGLPRQMGTNPRPRL